MHRKRFYVIAASLACTGWPEKYAAFVAAPVMTRWQHSRARSHISAWHPCYLVFRTLIRQRIRGGEGVRTGRQAARREVIKIGSAWKLGLSIVSKRLTAQGMDIAAIARAKIKRRLSIYTIPRETCAST